MKFLVAKGHVIGYTLANKNPRYDIYVGADDADDADYYIIPVYRIIYPEVYKDIWKKYTPFKEDGMYYVDVYFSIDDYDPTRDLYCFDVPSHIFKVEHL